MAAKPSEAAREKVALAVLLLATRFQMPPKELLAVPVRILSERDARQRPYLRCSIRTRRRRPRRGGARRRRSGRGWP